MIHRVGSDNLHGLGPFKKPSPTPGSRPALCRWGDCQRRATHYPGIALWAVYHYRLHDPVRVVIEAPMCRTHARKRGWLTMPLQRTIAASLEHAGKMAPDFKLADFFTVSIRDGDHPYTRRPTE